MYRGGRALVFALLPGFFISNTSFAQARPIVAVFDVEVMSAKLGKGTIDNLNVCLKSLLPNPGSHINRELAAETETPEEKAGFTWTRSKPAGIEFTKREVTVAQYRLCVDAGKCSPPDSKEVHKACNWGYAKRNDHPVNCVSWRQATTFCEWSGGRLPSFEEWRSEATDKDARMYPWGFEPPTCDRAVSSKEENSDGCGKRSTWPVCSKPAGNSVSGLCDMAGNVAEWLSTMPPELEDYRVYIGGSWTDSIPDNRFFLLRITSTIYGQYVRQTNIGFRCVRRSR
jgi:formylglycine-generating enzyme required for sulfatase activity